MHPVCQSSTELFDCLLLENYTCTCEWDGNKTIPLSVESLLSTALASTRIWPTLYLILKKCSHPRKKKIVIYVFLEGPLFSTLPKTTFREKLRQVMKWILILVLFLAISFKLSSPLLQCNLDMIILLFYDLFYDHQMMKRNKNKRKVYCIL